MLKIGHTPDLTITRTNPHKERIPQYSQGMVIGLHQASSDTRILIDAAIACLKHIYKPGYEYQKAGVMLSNITPAGMRQRELFNDMFHPAPTCNTKLMATLDMINRKMGKGTMKIASEGIAQSWHMKTENKSPAYTTRWTELPVVR
jgi:DNA polymerase V